MLLVDDLVSPADRRLCLRPTARIVDVGKRGGCKSTPQAFIEKLMEAEVHRASAWCASRAVTPSSSAAAVKRWSTCAAPGIEVQVINGITAGLAGLSSLGAPLTHRDHAHGVVFITGHAKPGDAGTDWRPWPATAIAAQADPGDLHGRERGRADQRRACRPVACPRTRPRPSFNTPACRSSAMPLPIWQNLADTLHAQNLASPSVLVIGNVVQGVAAWALQASSTPPLQAAC